MKNKKILSLNHKKIMCHPGGRILKSSCKLDSRTNETGWSSIRGILMSSDDRIQV